MILQGVEKRKCRRFQVPGAMVRYKKDGLLALTKRLSKPRLVVNLSKGGLAFECEQKFLRNEKIMTQLFISNEDPLKLRAWVRWQDWSSGSRSHFTGVEFKPFGKRRGWNSLEALDILRKLDDTYGEDE